MARSIVKILNLAGDLPEDFQAILNDFEVELIEESEALNASFDYIIINHYHTDFHKLDLQYKIVEKNVHIISLSKIEDKMGFFNFNGVAILDSTLMNHRAIRKIISRLISKKAAIRLEYEFGDLLHDFKHFKLLGHLYSGHFTDVIAMDSYAKGFNIVAIRNFFLGALTYFSYLDKSNIGNYPVEVDFGVDEELFVLQLAVPVNNFVLEFIWECFSRAEYINPKKGVLRYCHDFAHFFDIFLMKKSKKLCFTGVWLKEELLENFQFFPSLSIKNVQSDEVENNRWPNNENNPKILIESIDKEVIRELENHKLPGKYFNTDSKKVDWPLNDPLLAKRVLSFIHNFRSSEEFPRDLETLKIEDIEHYLSFYPNQEAIDSFSKEDKEALMYLLREKKMLDSIDESLEEARNSLEENPDYVQDVMEGVDNLSVEHIAEYLESKDGMLDRLEDEIMVIKGSSESEEDTVFKLKSLNNEGHDDLYAFKEKWNDVKSSIMEDLKSELPEGETINYEFAKSKIKEVMSRYVSMDEEAQDMVVEGILEDSLKTNVIAGLDEKVTEIYNDLEDQFGDIDAIREVARKDGQIDRMRDLLGKMKVEINALREFKNQTLQAAEAPEEKEDIDEKEEILKSIERKGQQIQMLNEEKSFLNQRYHDATLKIEELENQLREANAELGPKGQETLEKLSEEVDTLNQALELANQKLANASVGGDEDFKAKAYEILDMGKKLQQQVFDQQRIIENQKNEIEELNEGLMIGDKSESLANSEASMLKTQLAKAQEESKTKDISISRLEIKIKGLEKNLAKANKAKGGPGGGSGGGEEMSAKATHKIKQLEKLREKTESMNKKIMKDLNNKKKEVVQLKSENMAMKNQLDVLNHRIQAYKKKYG